MLRLPQSRQRCTYGAATCPAVPSRFLSTFLMNGSSGRSGQLGVWARVCPFDCFLSPLDASC